MYSVQMRQTEKGTKIRQFIKELVRTHPKNKYTVTTIEYI